MTHPPIDFEQLGPIDMGRFERAMSLEARVLDRPGQYRVVNPLDPKCDPHNVDLASADVPRCDCGDHLWRNKLCKHILACLIALGHPATGTAMAAWFAMRRA